MPQNNYKKVEEKKVVSVVFSLVFLSHFWPFLCMRCSKLKNTTATFSQNKTSKPIKKVGR
jgi:hypothetical protein